jgi:N-acetylglutamate synthase-like GNAT family acetyltransferase
MTYREFQEGDEQAFRELNEEWISKYFVLEAKDVEALRHPREKILERGGRIFLAVCEGETVGCCALLPMAAGEFEVAKMAVEERMRGGGIGRGLLAHVIEEAKAAGARRLYLETNQKLTPAVRLYEAVGFRHLPPERVVPSPYARADVYMELDLK